MWCGRHTVILQTLDQDYCLWCWRLFRETIVCVKRVLSNAFGKCIRSFRQQKGWSQEKLAECSGVHPTHIGLIERGKRNPSIDVADAIANALGQKLSSLTKSAEQGLEVLEEQ